MNMWPFKHQNPGATVPLTIETPTTAEVMRQRKLRSATAEFRRPQEMGPLDRALEWVDGLRYAIIRDQLKTSVENGYHPKRKEPRKPRCNRPRT